MSIAAKLDDLGKPAWITLMILSFMAYWPAGLAVLAFLIWSGRMRAWKHGGCGRWQGGQWREQWQEARDRWRGTGRGTGWGGSSSGNHAFDEYRSETLRRLEEEQREFREFLDRLRQAKDKAEFDDFMAQRGRSNSNPNPDAHGPQTPSN
jgi:Protein of unknown function (DUF2852)